ncbi:MAG: macro domain-containing protein [Candidatus Omnitrophota bacterium]
MILFEKVIGIGDRKRIFRLVTNSIIEENVDAIVNPANESLAHGGGVAGLIANAGGPAIQAESDQKAPVKTGEATFTTAGALPYQYIIHTVGPIYRGGTHHEAELLASAVRSALTLADQLHLQSLSLPSISTGIFGYPLAPAIRIIVQTIVDFLSQDSSLEEVHLCDYSASKAAEIKRIIETLF